jgi:transcriptional regulator with XRE-family HTH domain
MSISKVLREYREKNNLTTAQMANELGVPVRSLQAWVSGERIPQKPSHREVLEQKFPGIFAEEQQQPADLAEKPKPATDSAEVFANISLARVYIAALGRIFLWFLFETSAKERNLFREKLGGDWNYFFDLCRAMLGEKAFEVVKRETGITDKTKEDRNE